MVTAKAVGLALIVASASCCDVADTVEVRVTQVPAEVVVSPSSYTLTKGESYQLSGVVKDAMGYVIPGLELSWSSDNSSIATVNGSGEVMGQSAGTTQIRGAYAELVDGATVGVMEGSSPPSASLYPNQPSGMTKIFQYDGTSRDLGGNWSYGNKWASGSHVSVIEDPSNPLGSGYSLLFQYDGDSNSAGFANLSEFPDGLVQELYIMYRVHYAPDYAHREKHFYIGADPATRGGGATQYYMTYDGKYEVQDLYDQYGGNGLIWRTARGSVPLNGVWGQLEWRLIAESAVGAGDGEAYMYFNGELLASARGIAWTRVTDGSTGFSGTQFWTSSGGAPPATWFKVGEWYMSGR